jgi:hypothetical protein
MPQAPVSDIRQGQEKEVAPELGINQIGLSNESIPNILVNNDSVYLNALNNRKVILTRARYLSNYHCCRCPPAEP